MKSGLSFIGLVMSLTLLADPFSVTLWRGERRVTHIPDYTELGTDPEGIKVRRSVRRRCPRVLRQGESAGDPQGVYASALEIGWRAQSADAAVVSFNGIENGVRVKYVRSPEYEWRKRL